MLSASARSVGQRIRAARENAGWSQADLAVRMGRTQTAISYWESGRRLPGLDDLIELADVFGLSPAALLPASSARTPNPIMLRSVAEDIDSKILANQLEDFATEAEKLPVPEVRWTVPSSSPRDAAESLLVAARITGSKFSIEELVAGCGVRLLPWDFQDVDGLVVQLESGPVIGVHGQQPDTRRRFTTAHELGHCLLRHVDRFYVDFGGDLAPSGVGEHPHHNWRAERAANDFAANLLMPAGLVRSEFANTSDVGVLATKFEVSTSAMGYRLLNLGLRKPT